MAVRKILTMDKPVLRAKAKKVSRFDSYIERLVADLWDTMRDAPGVGLAAPQIGESVRVFVAEYEGEQVAFVNPEIIKRSEEIVLGTEGCLSIPGYVGENVPRAAAITVKGRNPKGKEIRVKAEGWFARILQHEIDHLDGVLYIDHIRPEDVREVTEDDIESESEGGPVDQPEAGRGKDGKGAKKTDKHASSGKAEAAKLARPERQQKVTASAGGKAS
jgi:peptide deformylase